MDCDDVDTLDDGAVPSTQPFVASAASQCDGDDDDDAELFVLIDDSMLADVPPQCVCWWRGDDQYTELEDRLCATDEHGERPAKRLLLSCDLAPPTQPAACAGGTAASSSQSSSSACFSSDSCVGSSDNDSAVASAARRSAPCAEAVCTGGARATQPPAAQCDAGAEDEATTSSDADPPAATQSALSPRTQMPPLARRHADRVTSMKIEGLVLHFLHLLADSPADGTQVAVMDPHSDGSSTVLIPLTRRYLLKVASVMRLMRDAHSLLANNEWRTKRDVFYKGKMVYGRPWRFDAAVSDACNLLQCTRSSLHLTTTAKGLIYGNISWSLPATESTGGGGSSAASDVESSVLVDCSQTPVLIYCNTMRSDRTQPVEPDEYVFHHSEQSADCAKFVLVVEKDAVFQNLIDERASQVLGPFIMVTGKGYPDIATRSLLRALITATRLPVFALVDADPAGYEIYLNFKYGPKAWKHESRSVELPELQLLGIMRSDVDFVPVPHDQFLPLSALELHKVRKLKQRQLVCDDAILMRELNCLVGTNSKLEIEAVSAIRPGYFIDVYLKDKLHALL